MTTKEVLELQLTLWRERMGAVQLKSSLLQAQTTLLQLEAKECQGEIARLDAALKEEAKNAPQDTTPSETEPPLRAVAG